MTIQLKSLEDSKKALLSLNEKEVLDLKEWSAYHIFVHCSKTIEYSMTGYPKMKPVIIRGTVGKLAINKFLKQGYMNHNLKADVPGSPVINDKGSFHEGRDILLQSIEKFMKFEGELKPHLLFGKLDRNIYDMYFAMHIADHLSELVKK
jgi:hypothetical protein